MSSDHGPAAAGDRESRLDEFVAAPRRAVWTMAAPMMAGMVVHTLYMVVDTAFIGALGTDALAAATFVGPLFFLMLAVTMGMATAVTALVAQAVGRREAGGGDRVAGTALTVGVAMGLGLTLLGLVAGRRILAILGASGTTGELAWQYFRIIAAVAPLFFVTSVQRSVLTGEGDARTPTLVLTGSTIVNIGLDALFIFGLGMGIAGAAVATGAASLFSLVAFTVALARRKRAFVRFRLGALLPSRGVLARIAALGVPTGAGMLVMSVGAMAMNRVLAAFGDVAVAAYGAANKVDMIVGMPIFGLAGAAVSIVGMFAGAGRADLVRSTALYTYRWAVTLAVVIGGVAFLASPVVLRAFTQDAEAIAIGRGYLQIMLFLYPLMAVGMTTGRLLQGLGHGLPSLVITSVRVLIIAVPAAYASVYLFDAPLQSVWLAMLTGALCATVLAAFWVRRLIWQQDPTLRAQRSAAPA